MSGQLHEALGAPIAAGAGHFRCDAGALGPEPPLLCNIFQKEAVSERTLALGQCVWVGKIFRLASLSLKSHTFEVGTRTLHADLQS